MRPSRRGPRPRWSARRGARDVKAAWAASATSSSRCSSSPRHGGGSDLMLRGAPGRLRRAPQVWFTCEADDAAPLAEAYSGTAAMGTASSWSTSSRRVLRGPGGHGPPRRSLGPRRGPCLPARFSSSTSDASGPWPGRCSGSSGSGRSSASSPAGAGLAAFGFAEVARTEEGIAERPRLGHSRLMRQLLPCCSLALADPDPGVGLLGLRRLADGPGRAQGARRAVPWTPRAARRVCVVLGTQPPPGRHLVATLTSLACWATTATDCSAPTAELAGRCAGGGRVAGGAAPARPRPLPRREGSASAADVLGALSTRRSAPPSSAWPPRRCRPPSAPSTPSVGAQGGAGGGWPSSHSGASAGPRSPTVGSRRRLLVPSGRGGGSRAVGLALLRFLGDGPGRVYDVDADLRPEGRERSPLVRSVDSWAAYVERWAEPWGGSPG